MHPLAVQPLQGGFMMVVAGGSDREQVAVGRCQRCSLHISICNGMMD
jgi:hypothetical protein